MIETNRAADVSAGIAEHLPFLRRYARALTGNQASGDAYAAATLETILEDRSIFSTGLSPRVALFRVFHTVWNSAGALTQESEGRLERAAQDHLSVLTPQTRQALLLHSIEQFSIDDISHIMRTSQREVEGLLEIAQKEVDAHVAGDILIIEDEPIIAMDIHGIVSSMGHNVVGIGRTRDGAVDLGARNAPDLILADIRLADDSSGIDAVNDLFAQFGEIPVIFITAFPERLLTGERPEPAFLIAKPYTEDQVRSAVGQAMFFASSETLLAG